MARMQRVHIGFSGAADNHRSAGFESRGQLRGSANVVADVTIVRSAFVRNLLSAEVSLDQTVQFAIQARETLRQFRLQMPEDLFHALIKAGFDQAGRARPSLFVS